MKTVFQVIGLVSLLLITLTADALAQPERTQTALSVKAMTTVPMGYGVSIDLPCEAIKRCAVSIEDLSRPPYGGYDSTLGFPIIDATDSQTHNVVVVRYRRRVRIGGRRYGG